MNLTFLIVYFCSILNFSNLANQILPDPDLCECKDNTIDESLTNHGRVYNGLFVDSDAFRCVGVFYQKKLKEKSFNKTIFNDFDYRYEVICTVIVLNSDHLLTAAHW